MYRSVIFCFLYSIFHIGYGQLPIGSIIPAMQAGNTALNLLPPQARDCVNKVTTKAVSDSLVSKLASSAGGLLGNAAPQITRDPGTVECKNNVPYYKETTHLKANVFNLPIDLPVTTESDLTSCLQGPLNFCTAATGLLGANGGNLVNSLTGANKPNPTLNVGGTSLGGSSNTNTQTGGGNPLGQLFSGGGVKGDPNANANVKANANNGVTGSNGNSNPLGQLLGGGNGGGVKGDPNANGNNGGNGNAFGHLLQNGRGQ